MATEKSVSPPANDDGIRNAGILERFLALLVDWILCLLIARGLVATGALPEAVSWLWPSGVLVVEYAAFLGFLLQTPGMWIARIYCVDFRSGAPLGVPRAIVRGALLAVIVPALTTFLDADQRGLHDKAAGSIVVKRETPRD